MLENHCHVLTPLVIHIETSLHLFSLRSALNRAASGSDSFNQVSVKDRIGDAENPSYLPLVYPFYSGERGYNDKLNRNQPFCLLASHLPPFPLLSTSLSVATHEAEATVDHSMPSAALLVDYCG